MTRMRKPAVIIMLIMSMIMLTACAKSEFGVTENTGKRMVITAKNADRDAAVMTGTLEVAQGEKIEIKGSLKKGEVKVEIVAVEENQSIDKLPEIDGPAILTANITQTDGASATMDAGSYMLRAACQEKATGTITVEVVPGSL